MGRGVLAGRQSGFLVGLLLLTYLVLASTYNLINPLFEAPDEIWHYHYVRHLAEGKGLPREEPDRSNVLGQAEGAQPPLYYAVAAAVTFWAPRGDLRSLAVRNPAAAIGVPARTANNRNVFLHGPSEAFPWFGEVFTVHLVRFISTLWGALAVLLTFRIGRFCFSSDALAFLAAAVVAYTPQFLFISAAVSNDAAVAAVSALTLWLSIRTWREHATARRCAVLGVVAGLVVLTKPLAIGAIGLVGLSVIGSDWRGKVPAKTLARNLSFLVIAFVLTCGWWFVFNERRYGTPVPLATFVGSSTGTIDLPVHVSDWIGELRGLAWSYWALFGWFSVLAPSGYYRLFGLLTALGMIGLGAVLIGSAKRRRAVGFDAGAVALVGVWALITISALFAYRFVVTAFQGRLLFSAISAFAILLVLGWSSLAPARLSAAVASLGALALIVVAALAPWTILRPAYAPPAIYAVGEVKPTIPLKVRFGDDMRLIGVDLRPAPHARLRPGDEIAITLYLEALRPMTKNYMIALHLDDLIFRHLGEVDSHPGQGRLPTSTWKPGQVIVDRYHVRIRADAPTPSVANLAIALYRFPTMIVLPSYGPGGELEGSPTVGPFVVEGKSDLKACQGGIVFGDTLSLVKSDILNRSVSPGGEVVGHLLFGSVHPTQTNYTVFVHLDRSDGKSVAGADAQAAGGAYPTSFWQPGDLVDHEFHLRVPLSASPGTYHVHVGWYELATGRRLVSRTGDAIDVGTLVVR